MATISSGTTDVNEAAVARPRIIDYAQQIGLVTLVALDMAVRIYAAKSHYNYFAADMLAPYSIVDQILHGELPDAGRQQLGYAAVTAGLVKVAGVREDAGRLIHAVNIVTAITSSLVLIPLYYLARRLIGIGGAFIALLLLMSNPSYLVESSAYNPTQMLVLCFTGMCVAAVRVQEDRSVAAYRLFWALACVAYFVRHEGLIFLTAAALTSGVFCKLGHVRRRDFVLGLACGATGLAAGWLAHRLFTAQPYAYLENTNATGDWFEAIHYEFSDQVMLVVRAVQWKLEKLTAFVVMLTLPGCVIAGIAAWHLRRNAALWFASGYFVIYEAAMLVYTLAVPVGGDHYVPLRETFDSRPCLRYDQIYLPLACLLLAYALRQFATLVLRRAPRELLVACVVVLVVGFQGIVAYHSHRSLVAASNHRSVQLRNLDIARYFRESGIRRASLLVCSLKDNALKIDVSDPMWTHPIHLSVLSGNNDVNCWHYDLAHPNISCIDRYKTDDVAELLAMPQVPKNYVIVLGEPPNGSQRELLGEPVATGGGFHIFRLPHPGENL